MKVWLAFLVFSLYGYGKNFALIVGIDNYLSSLSVPKLYGAKNDAKAFEALLLTNGFLAENIIVLLDENATKDAIVKALVNLETKMQKGRKDTFYYFHAGHGARLSDVDVEISSDRKTAVLLPYDFSPKVENSFLLTHNDLRPHFEQIDKKISFGMLSFDSCFSGYASRGTPEYDNNRYQTRFYDKPIKMNKNNFKLKANLDEYAYNNIIALSASSSTEKSKEDMKVGRGVFSMAMEHCLQEEKKTTIKSLKNCLDRKYTIQRYVFDVPDQNMKKDIFELNQETLAQSKAVVYTQIDLEELALLKEVALLESELSKTVEFELVKEGELYTLLLMPEGRLIDKFKTIEKVKTFLSGYRLMRLSSKNEKGVDMNITYDGAAYKDNDIVPAKSYFDIRLHSVKKGYLALFSLSKEGKLYMIEPVGNYRKIEGNMVVNASTDHNVGTEFLKAFVFPSKNELVIIRVDEKTGEVLNVNEQIESILKICKKTKFASKLHKITTVKKEQ